MTYTNLKARVLSRFQSRSDLTTIIANAINDIRHEICGGEISLSSGRVINHRWSFCFATTTQATTTSDYNYDNPTGCIEIVSITYGTDILEKISFELWQETYQGSTSTGTPTIWVPRAEEYWVYPIPDAAYTLNLYYYKYLTDLSADADEYDLEARFPGLVLDGASMIVAEHLMDEKLASYYASRYEKRLLAAYTHDRIAERVRLRPRFKTWREDDVVDDRWMA